MLWKVYAQNVRVPKGKAISEITEKELSECIDKEYYSWLENTNIDYPENDSDFDSVFDAFNMIAKAKFERCGVLGFGDYIVIDSEDYPDRPNMAGDIDIDEDDILKFIEGNK